MKDEQTYYKIKKKYELLKAEVAHLKEHIAYLERQLYGSKRDKFYGVCSLMPLWITIYDELVICRCV